MWTRRAFVTTAAAAAGLTFVPTTRGRQAKSDPTALTVVRLGEQIWFLPDSGGSNALLIRTRAGAVLVDTKHAPRGRELERTCLDVTGTTPTVIVNTHHHADHTGGNWAFGPPSSQVYGHAKMPPRLAANLDQHRRRAESYGQWLRMQRASPERLESASEDVSRILAAPVDAYLPSILFEDEHDLEVGGEPVRLRHFGPAHTDNDAIVYFPTLKVAHVGDLVMNGMHPYVNRADGASIRQWEAALQKLAAMLPEDTLLVPGHGKQGDRSLIADTQAYFTELRSVTQLALRQGMSREQVVGLKPPAFADLGFAHSFPVTIGSMYDELVEEGS